MSGYLKSWVIFIVGVGRSGTSLLQSMLHAHPEIAFLPETHFFRRYVARPLHRRRHEQAGAAAFRSTLTNDEEYHRAGISPSEILKPFLEGGRDLDVVEAYARLLERYRVQKGATVVGAKDPRLIDYLDVLHRAFPEASVLHIVRDPRDVLLSRMKADWSAGRPDWLHALTYRAQIRRGRQQGRKCFRERYMEVQYEKLLTDPEQALHAVAEHIGIPYSDAMLAFGSAAQELVDERERAWKKETMGPLLTANKEKWRDGLSRQQVRMVEAVCERAFRWFDYERAGLSPDGASYAQRAMLWVAPFIGGGFEMLYAAVSRFR